MTEIYRKYRLTSSEEPTDDMLHALMEDVVVEAADFFILELKPKNREFIA